MKYVYIYVYTIFYKIYLQSMRYQLKQSIWIWYVDAPIEKNVSFLVFNETLTKTYIK